MLCYICFFDLTFVCYINRIIISLRFKQIKDMQKRWSVREMPDQGNVEKLASELNIDPVLSAILCCNAALAAFEEARFFLQAGYPPPARSFPDG
jgi:hypothetical protein